MEHIFEVAIGLVILFPAIVLHEVAHGYVAYLLGDETAKRAGRLSLNPLVHVDLVGTVILPLILLVTGSSFLIGWAKPVPINPYAFKDRKTGMLITGAAGPAMNLSLAVVVGLIARIMPTAGSSGILGQISSVYDVLIFFVYMNLLLLFFNLIPIPPLDGSRIVQRLLSGKAAVFYDSLERYGFIIIFGSFYVAPGLFSGYLSLTVAPLFSIITGVTLI